MFPMLSYGHVQAFAVVNPGARGPGPGARGPGPWALGPARALGPAKYFEVNYVENPGHKKSVYMLSSSDRLPGAWGRGPGPGPGTIFDGF